MSIFNQVAAVIFDHDGTLVDSEPIHLACWQRALAPFGKKLSPQQYAANLSGIASIRSAEWLVEQLKLEVAAEALLALKQGHLDQYLSLQACPIMVGVKELLTYLWQRQIPMAVASGAGKAEVLRSLEYHQIGHYFNGVFTKEDVKLNKPAPDVYLLAAQSLAVAPTACLAIEDSDSGQRAALAAGMFCLRLATPTQLPPALRCQTIANMNVLLNY